MKITVEFESLEEFQQFAKKPEAPAEKHEEPAPAPKKEEPKERKPAEAEKPAPEPPEKPEKKPSVDRVAVRKALSQLNKKTGQNTAHELISTFGVEKFTQVKDEDLEALYQKAKEALDA